MFGPIMETVSPGGVTLRLAPYARDDMAAFITGMQSHHVLRYLTTNVQTLESEHEWYDKNRQDPRSLTWGIWVQDNTGWTLIGSSALHSLNVHPIRQATSGSLIMCPEYWGQGIASTLHKVRLWYGFTQWGLVRIKSAVMDENIGSRRALERSGYFWHSQERNVKFVDGRLRHQINLECLNPADWAWSNWWNEDAPSPEALEAQIVTIEALQWAEANVRFI